MVLILTIAIKKMAYTNRKASYEAANVLFRAMARMFEKIAKSAQESFQRSISLQRPAG
jgi:hypothetical protein